LRGRHDYVYREANQFGRQYRQTLALALGVSVLDENAGPRRPAEVPEAAFERVPLAKIAGRRVARPKYADAWDLRRLLRLDSERHKNEAQNENDREPDPPHGHLSEMAGGSLADDR